MEFITDVTACIDQTGFRDLKGLKRILQSYSTTKKGSCYMVTGTFREVEELSLRLSSIGGPIGRPETDTWTNQEEGQGSAGLRSVDVSRSVLDYIKQRCNRQLETIIGSRFTIQTGPAESSSSVRVTFKPLHASSVTSVHADFTRQRFITFYQRVASDLQTTSVSPQHLTVLQKRFPQLLFQTGPQKPDATVIGHFVHIAKLKEFLLPRAKSSLSPGTRAPTETRRSRGKSETRGLTETRSTRSPETRDSESPESKGLTETRSTRSPEAIGLSETRSPGTRGALEIRSSRTSDAPPGSSKRPEGPEVCAICMEPIRTLEEETLRCQHSFCRDCLKMAFGYKPVCPTCGTVYGLLTGTQPEGGTMRDTRRASSLPGYENHGTIIIHYHIPSGIQKVEHPNPGQPYEGVSRTAYLPDSTEGRQVLQLLQKAFSQRLVFTVGRSTTSGRNNTVTWNDIHHKTSTHGGATQYGYPDPDYLSRVRDELRVKGIK